MIAARNPAKYLSLSGAFFTLSRPDRFCEKVDIAEKCICNVVMITRFCFFLSNLKLHNQIFSISNKNSHLKIRLSLLNSSDVFFVVEVVEIVECLRYRGFRVIDKLWRTVEIVEDLLHLTSINVAKGLRNRSFCKSRFVESWRGQ